MAIKLITGLESVNWHELAVVFERAPLGQREPGILRQTFQNSSVRCFAYENSAIIGAGRALTDFINWTVIFDVVLLPEHQGFGHGRAIMQSLVEQSKARNVMLHSAPGKEGFYECLGYRRMKTAMALFANPERARDLKYIE
jgi:GNAT superfamily N-acetyltransferase